jgi:hypothetical protein
MEIERGMSVVQGDGNPDKSDAHGKNLLDDHEEL